MFGRPMFGGGFGQPRRTEFRAGRCEFSNGTVTPLKEKGRISVGNDEHGLPHFQWKSRVSNQIVDDFIIMPNDAQWVKVPQCKGGRVFLLDYGTDNSRHFYWLQEPSDEKDEEYFKAVKAVVSPGEESPAAGAGAAELSQDQLLTMLNEAPQTPATPTPSAPVPAPQASPITPAPATPASAAPVSGVPGLSVDFLQAALQAAAQGGSQKEDIPLTAVLKADSVAPLLKDLLRDDEIRSRLVPHLPPSQTSESAIEESIRSPQLQQTLKTLTAALRHGQAGTVLASMGLNPQQAGPEGGVQALLRAIQAEADANRPQSMDVDEDKPATTPKKGDDDDMDLYG